MGAFIGGLVIGAFVMWAVMGSRQNEKMRMSYEDGVRARRATKW